MKNTVVPANFYEAVNAYQRLQACLTTDDLKTAIMEIKTFLKIYPDLSTACNDLGVLYYRAGEKLLALACYEKANRLQPGVPNIIKNLAEFYFVELGWTDDAIMMLTGLLKLHPQDTEVLTALGLISERIGRGNEARSFFLQVLDLDPTNAAVREALARVGAGAQTVRPFPTEEPVQPILIPESAPKQDGQLEDILARLRSTINADTVAVPASPMHPQKTADELYREAQWYVGEGDDSKAISVLENLVEIYPMYAVASNDLGVLYTKRGDLQKALYFQEAAVTQSPVNFIFRKNLAALYYSCLGRTDEAIEMYTKLLREKTDDIETLTALAIISSANNLRDQARTFISKVLELQPWNSAARDFFAGL